MGRARSFAEVALAEAIARRARVDLVLKPVTPSTDKRLRSRFLGVARTGGLVLDVPVGARVRRVYLPCGWELGMAFPVGGFLLQTRTTVLDHCQFALYPTRRVDAVVVARPGRILAVNRRKQPRYEVDPSRTVVACLWPAEALISGGRVFPRVGRLKNFSREGLGLVFPTVLPYEPGTEMVLRLEEHAREEHRLVSAVFRHSTALGDGQWLAGFSDVVELGPGQRIGIIESLAGTSE